MICEDTKRIAEQLLWEELDKVPLATVTSVPMLASASPFFIDRGKRTFEVVGGEHLLDKRGIDAIEDELWRRAEECGLYVEHVSTRRFVLMQRIVPGSPIAADEIARFHFVVDDEVDCSQDMRIELNGGMMRFVRYVPKKVIEYEADTSSRHAIERVLAMSGASSWLPCYEPDYAGADGSSWALHVVLMGGKTLTSEGDNAWPEGFEILQDGLLSLFGDIASQSAKDGE